MASRILLGISSLKSTAFKWGHLMRKKAHELLNKMNFYFAEWEDPQVCMPSDMGSV